MFKKFKIEKASVLMMLFTWALHLPMAAVAQEDISVIQGSYEVFYSAFNTSFISPEVASAAGIVRGKNKGLINISIVRYDDSGQRFPVKALSIEGESYDLIYRNALDFKEIVEQGARYYLAPFKISSDNEFIKFDVTVEPEGAEKPVELSFKRRFFKN